MEPLGFGRRCLGLSQGLPGGEGSKEAVEAKQAGGVGDPAGGRRPWRRWAPWGVARTCERLWLKGGGRALEDCGAGTCRVRSPRLERRRLVRFQGSAGGLRFPTSFTMPVKESESTWIISKPTCCPVSPVGWLLLLPWRVSGPIWDPRMSCAGGSPQGPPASPPPPPIAPFARCFASQGGGAAFWPGVEGPSCDLTRRGGARVTG